MLPAGMCKISTGACLAFIWLAQASRAPAQEAEERDVSSSAPSPVLNVSRGNPLEGLFTPQLQFPTAQTIFNPQPTAPAPGELNPLKNLFTPQPQYQTPQALTNPQPEPPAGEVNHLKGVFTPPNQFATAQTVLNPHAVPKHLVPERQLLWGAPEEQANLIRRHNLATFGTENPRLQSAPQAILPGGKEQEREKQAHVGSAPSGKSRAESLPQAPGQAGGSLRLALTMIRRADYAQACQLLTRVIDERPGDAQPHYLKAVALVNLRRYSEAESEYDKVLRLALPGDSLSGLARTGLQKIRR